MLLGCTHILCSRKCLFPFPHWTGDTKPTACCVQRVDYWYFSLVFPFRKQTWMTRSESQPGTSWRTWTSRTLCAPMTLTSSLCWARAVLARSACCQYLGVVKCTPLWTISPQYCEGDGWGWAISDLGVRQVPREHSVSLKIPLTSWLI